MKRYRCIFYGRKVNALGISSFHCLDLEAPDPDAARLKIYDTHEHLSQVTVIDQTTKEVFKP